MVKQYRYRPKDNRTPVNHPLFGHLEWDTIVENPEAAHDPSFEEIQPKQPKRKPAPKTKAAIVPGVAAATPDPSSKPAAESKPADDPAPAGPAAGEPGRSK